MNFASVCAHDPIEPIAADVFMVRGSFRLNPIIRITRNMAIVREQAPSTRGRPSIVS